MDQNVNLEDFFFISLDRNYLIFIRSTRHFGDLKSDGKIRRSVMAKVLPLLCVCCDWLLSQPQYLSHATPSASADTLETELMSKENRSRSSVRSSLALLLPQVDALLAQKKAAVADRQKIVMEQIELRGFPPFANGNNVKFSSIACKIQ